MSDEKNNRDDAGRSPDDAADFDAPEQPTEVIVPRRFFARSLRNLGEQLVAAGGTVVELGRMVESGGGPLALEEVDEVLAELEATIAGARRGHGRVKPGLKTEGTDP